MKIRKGFHNAVSYLYPHVVEARQGNVTPYLEVLRRNGKYILNSSRVNYSYGGLHLVFEDLFEKVNINRYQFKNVLLLGMGAGSIISLLREKYHLDFKITALEKDDVVIELAERYFNIGRFKNLEIVNRDAFEYVLHCTEKFDMVIVDLFIEEDVPAKFASASFLSALKNITAQHACVIYNKMIMTDVHATQFAGLTEKFNNIFPFSTAHQLTSYGSRNSLLYFNTLPVLAAL